MSRIEEDAPRSAAGTPSAAPKVSVCMITYNHEHYIAQAIESVMMQHTTFAVELVVGEDCSTDNTRAIIEEYQQRYPGKIRIVFTPNNVGPNPNFIRTCAACRGEYIALLEGDDYWTDPTKLQRQVDALSINGDFAFCFHDAETFIDGSLTFDWKFSERFAHILPADGENPQTYTQLDLARWGWFIPTASMLFRASSFPNPLPDWFGGVYSGDFTLQLLSTRNGVAIYLPRVMSNYRLHTQSVTRITTLTPYQFTRYIHEGKMFQQHVFEPKYRKYADIYLAQKYESYAKYLGHQGQWAQKLNYSVKSLFLNLKCTPLHFERQWAKLRNMLNS